MKKIQFLLLSLLLTWPVTAMAQSSIKGDVNGDGTVNITDLNIVINMIIDDTASMIADVNGDGSVNIADINAVISIIIDGPAEEEEDEYVDLGLPSGTLWATRNVGASRSYEYGDRFAWGEVEPKEVYNWSTYKWCNGSDSTLTKYNSRSELGTVDNKTELDPEDDAAYVNWGSEWRMPSREQMNELVELCKWQNIQRNGVDGTLFTGPNGNTMFLPDVSIWSRTTVFLLDGASIATTDDRDIGKAVRAVRESPVDRPDIHIEQQSLELGCVTIGKSCTGQLTIVNNSPDSITLTASTEEPFSFIQKEDNLVSTTVVVPGNSRDTVTVMFTTATPGDCSANVTFQNPALDGGQIVIPVHAIAFPNVVPKEDYIDLGLPSGSLWATCNVGANSPEETGDRLAWGETEPKEKYTWDTYKWYGGSGLTKYCLNSNHGTVDGKMELDLEDDAAYVNWGPEWRMPSCEQIEELSKNCIWRISEMNGVKGSLLTGPNGNSIFLPTRNIHLYWSRSLCSSNSHEVPVLSKESIVHYTYRFYGLPVRAAREPLSITPQNLDLEEVYLGDTDTVKLTIVNKSHHSIKLTATVDAPFMLQQEDESVSRMNVVVPGDSSIMVTVSFTATTLGEFNGDVTIWTSDADWHKYVIPVHARAIPEPIPWEEYVDLGLPSGTLWATMNIGADRPQAYGDYFAWGETSPKEEYSWETYKWCNGSGNSLTKYCTDSVYGTVDNKVELEPDDDAAYVNWGALWRIPTLEQQQELIDSCTWTWTTKKGVKGYLVTGPNKNSMFLPAAGYRHDSATYSEGSYGDFWSRTLHTSYSDYACDMYYFDSNGVHWATSNRFMGYTLRAVHVPIDIYIEQGSLDLGEVPIGETITGELTVVNSGNEDITLTATADEPFSFKVENGSVSTMPITIPGYSRGTVTVMFKATALGNFNGNVTFHSPRFDGGQTVIPVHVNVTVQPEYVDLGLPSGTLWATRNIGADNPEDYGDYFSWGEIEPKELYKWSTYKWCKGSYSTLTKYCTNSDYGTVDDKVELEPADDAAFMNWGSEWRMPSFEQVKEMRDNCHWEWTSRNGVDGFKVIGPSGNSIFLPAAGFKHDNSLIDAGMGGSCLSSTLSEIDPRYAYYLDFTYAYVYWGGGYLREYGYTVRPVRASHN